jgi:hypothetical protein
MSWDTARGEWVGPDVVDFEPTKPPDYQPEVGLVWHFGWEGFATGDIANILSAVVGDPNTSIHEAKAFTCDLRRGRREATR